MLSAALAVGATLPPPLTIDRVFTAWQVEPGVLAAVALLGGGYAMALRRRQQAGRAWEWSRTACFAAGLVVIVIVGCSFLGVYDDALFWVRAVQNTLLLMVVPMFLALGAPIRLFTDPLPEHVRAPLSRALHSRTAQLLTFPLVVTVVLVVPLLALYLSPLYELTLRSSVASGISGTVIVVTGFLYFWTRFRLDPTPRTDSYLVTLSITVVEMIGDAVLGVVLWLGPLVAAGFYAALMRDWGPDLRTDQVIGAGILWIGGDVIGLPFILVVVGRFRQEDEGRAKVIDAQLDADEEAHPDEPTRLWWEDDPELSARFKRR